MPSENDRIFDSLLSSEFDGMTLLDEPMSRHTTYRIGGPAQCFVRADSVLAMKEVSKVCRDNALPLYIIGKGSNILASDEGVRGIVVVLGRDFRNFSVDGETQTVVSGSGVLLSAIVQEALRNSLEGMEFAVGTPGSIGGAIKMNAGTATDWIGSRVGSVVSINDEGVLLRRNGKDVEWGYRTTSFPPNEAILECELVLKTGDSTMIKAKMEASLNKRRRSQPLDLPSCGSVFRNPEGCSAAKMIDELGLKGQTHGGAQISEKHANFIVNIGGAKASDVLYLIDMVRAKVKEAYGKELSTEVRFLGFAQ